MAKKRKVKRMRQLIYRHQLRTSPVYEDLVNAPAHVVSEFISSFSNPLDQKYVEKRIEEARFNVALTRLDQLDPYPFEHRHEGCFGNGSRSAQIMEDEHDFFAPRDGYITNRESYDA